ncbi:pyruvate formate-lyase-activating protein [Thermotalea metallivorans]|uniref:pyruvate formate-lyase-activating protein n=1 Tax=Thermotalea metallivorans TaxID=520762 RepID=UPI00083983E9|nr:pyruvate formate-lyase-activating protein [Thermotalea metallivorans]
MTVKAKVHSVETCGTVDGPGIRYILFLSGCPLRCKYCHNCDTWTGSTGRIMDVDEIMEDVKKYRPYFHFSKGGITVSGGEPTMQYAFLEELLKRCKEEGIHTCIDTSGYCDLDKADIFLPYTDLVLLDLKHIDDRKHKELTGVSNEKILKFAWHLSVKGIPVWIRHVVVPGYTDDLQDVERLCQFMKELKNVERVELLPYHTMGVHKWEELGFHYELRDVQTPTPAFMEKIKAIFQKYAIKVS